MPFQQQRLLVLTPQKGREMKTPSRAQSYYVEGGRRSCCTAFALHNTGHLCNPSSMDPDGWDTISATNNGCTPIQAPHGVPSSQLPTLKCVDTSSLKKPSGQQ